MACHLFGIKPLSEPLMTSHQQFSKEQNFNDKILETNPFSLKILHLKLASIILPHFVMVGDVLTHWGRVTHICVTKLTIIGSDNGLWPDRRQAIIWTNAGILLIGPLGTNFNEILIKSLTFTLKKMRLKVSSAKRRPFCLGLNVLIDATLNWSK